MSLLAILPSFGVDSVESTFRKFIDYDYRKKIKFSDFTSSVLKEPGKPRDYYKYDNMADGDPNTAWVPAKPGGINEFFYSDFFVEDGFASYKKYPAITVELIIINGYAKSESLFQKNNRVKRGTLECYEGHVLPSQDNNHLVKVLLNSTHEITLDDTMKEQHKEFVIQPKLYTPKDREYKDANFHFMCKFTIKEIYRGTKYNHTPISEFRIGIK